MIPQNAADGVKQRVLRQTSFPTAIVAAARAADGISADDCPARVTLETGDNLPVEEVVEHARLDHVKSAVTVHYSYHHGAPLRFRFIHYTIATQTFC